MEYTTSVRLDRRSSGLACSEWTIITSTSSDLPGRVSWDYDATRHSSGRTTARVVGDDIHVLDLAGSGAIVGPQWFIERAEGISVDALLQPTRLLEIAGDPAGESPVPSISLSSATTGRATRRATADFPRGRRRPRRSLRCAHPTTAPRPTWRTGRGGSPPRRATEVLGCAAYSEFQGFVADVGVLTAPAHRRHGIGCAVAGLATEDALDCGLIPQATHQSRQRDRRDAST